MNYEQLLEHERDLHDTVRWILDNVCGGYEYFLDEFDKHLKVYEPDR